MEKEMWEDLKINLKNRIASYQNYIRSSTESIKNKIDDNFMYNVDKDIQSCQRVFHGIQEIEIILEAMERIENKYK